MRDSASQIPTSSTPTATSPSIFPPKAISDYLSTSISKKRQWLSLLALSSSLTHVTQTHAQFLVSGLHTDPYLVSQLIRFSSFSPRYKNLGYARSLLFHPLNPLSSSWNMLIRGYSSSDTPIEALWVFKEMRKYGVRPDKLTFPFVLKSCAGCLGLREGWQVHTEVVKFGLDGDVYVNNNLVHFYGSCRRVDDAQKVFDEMRDRAVVSWNAVIDACVTEGRLGDAVRYFLRMRGCGFEPDETTMVLVLSVCAEVGNLNLGRLVHCQVIGMGMELNYQLGTALIDMYAKGGVVDFGRKVFDCMEKRNVWTWSAMILGLAQHGFAREAVEHYEEMVACSSVRPNAVTFLGVLCACSHAGLVDDGFRYFQEMEHTYGIKPMMVHYGAMVDILSRAGRLKEAYNYVLNLPRPCQRDPVLWRTLLSACSVHDSSDTKGVADMVKKKLIELEPKRAGNLVMVAKMYADAGMWEKAESLRNHMRESGLKKKGGESCIELGGSVLSFFAGYHN